MPVQPPPTSAAQPSDATKAWHHLMRSTFHALPRELAKSHGYRMKLRRLSRRR